MKKIKIDKNGIGDIRQLTLNPRNPYVRDEDHLLRLIASYTKRLKQGLPPNTTPIIVYADGLIKGGNSRYTAGMESKNYYLFMVKIWLRCLLIDGMLSLLVSFK